MFEVEKKFILSENEISSLTEGAEFLGEKIMTDEYYDTKEFALTKNDMWLRNRDGKWELKIPKHIDGNSLSQQYQEVEGEEKLRQIFDIPAVQNFPQDIRIFGYFPFCKLTTTRKNFSKEGFVISLDKVESEDFEYFIVEIELMVGFESEMKAALERIENFAKQNNLQSRPVYGKVIEYLKIKAPDHFRALLEACVVKD